ncbi:unnamed protein product [Brugia pahangi]|uniref:Ferredoxin n=1 Tax=Brugia pahangi TaxID=6280 RepID=A0A0N4T380_BRUPA|nr:unnamed protein product [Brugia pahangi]
MDGWIDGWMVGYWRRCMSETGRVGPDTITGRQRWDRRTITVACENCVAM